MQSALDVFSDFWPGIADASADVCHFVEKRGTTQCEVKRSIDEFWTRAVSTPDGPAISGGLETFWMSNLKKSIDQFVIVRVGQRAHHKQICYPRIQCCESEYLC